MWEEHQSGVLMEGVDGREGEKQLSAEENSGWRVQQSPADISVHALHEGNRNMQSEAFFMQNYCNAHIS